MLTDEKRLYSCGGLSSCLGRDQEQEDTKTMGEIVVGEGHNQELINKIACGKSHVLALTESGKVFSWGKNDKGQLGIGQSYSEAERPTLIQFDKGIEIIDIFAGDSRSIAVAKQNTEMKL
jgi:alpha-tubulin suppressor-like RCC1 family protein